MTGCHALPEYARRSASSSVGSALPLLLLASSGSALSQETFVPRSPEPGPTAASLVLPPNFDGAPPPQLPAAVSRDAEGRTTVRAVRLTAPLRVDGHLDEDLYRTVTPISDFIRAEPQPGTPATEKTEVWVSFDDDNVYVSVRASESRPERMVVNEMRRDSNSIWQNENFLFAFDTFHDRRNSATFQFNPIGGRMDGQVTNENANQLRLESRLEVRGPCGATADGPGRRPSRSSRCASSRASTGLGLPGAPGQPLEERNLVPHESAGWTGHCRLSSGSHAMPTMVGIEVPPGSRALDVKPFVTSDLTTDLRGHTGCTTTLAGRSASTRSTA